MSRQKFKYLKNKESFQDEIKSIFDHFWRAIIEANEKIFLEGENPTLSLSVLLSVTEDIIYTLLRNINLLNRFYLTHVWPMFITYAPWQYKKTFGFLVSSGRIH